MEMERKGKKRNEKERKEKGKKKEKGEKKDECLEQQRKLTTHTVHLHDYNCCCLCFKNPQKPSKTL
jgi:hypothetical protein